MIKIDFRRPEWTAVIAAFVCGFFTHLFALVNVIHNYDDISMLPYGYGTGLSSGRWFLQVLGYVCGQNGGNFNLPVINGLIFILVLAVTAGFLVSIFHIQNKVAAALMGILFVVFPTVTATMFFRYTTVYNGIAILLAVLAVWVLQRNKFGLLLSAIFTGLSLGIYQAYVPITIGIFVILLIQQALKGNSNVRELALRGLYYCVSLVLGLLVYFVCLKILLALRNESLSYYQGVNNMGKIPLSDIPILVKKAFVTFWTFAKTDYCGLASIKLIKLSYLWLGIISVIMIGYILAVNVRKVSIAFITCLLCVVFPIAVNFIVIMCPDSIIYTLMVYSFVLVGCTPLILLECLPPVMGTAGKGQLALRKIITVILALLVSCYAYYANVNYAACYYATRQVENYMNSLVVQVRMTEGFDTQKKWAFIGNIEDPLLHCLWNDERKYGGNVDAEALLNQYSRISWIENYIGYTVPQASSEEIMELTDTAEVRDMPCWPDEGSIKVIGETIVIKCQNIPVQ